MASKMFEETVERGTGLSIRTIRLTPLDELRTREEQKRGRVLEFVSGWPWIGRGNVLRKRLVSREQIDRDVDDSLRQLQSH